MSFPCHPAFSRSPLRRSLAIGCLSIGLCGAGGAQSSRADALPELIAEAVAVHPAIRAGQATSKGAAYEVESARWQYFPTPSVETDYAVQDTTDGASDDPVTVFGLQQTLWSGGRLSAGVERAESLLGSSEAGVEVVKQEVAVEVIQGYADWYSAHLRHKAIQESLAAHQRLLKQVNRRIEEGQSPLSDRALAMTRIAQAQADLAGYEGQAAAALSQLTQLLGRDVLAVELAAALVEPYRLDPEAAGLRRRAFETSPQIKRALADSQSARAEARLASAALLPEVSVRFEQQVGNTFEAGTHSPTRVVVALRTQFGAGLSSLSNKSAAEIRAQAALDELDDIRLSIVRQLESDRLTLVSLRERERMLAAAISSADEVRSSYDRQYLEGRKSWLDVMNAERELAQVSVQMSDVLGGQIATSWRLAVLLAGTAAVVQGRPLDAL